MSPCGGEKRRFIYTWVVGSWIHPLGHVSWALGAHSVRRLVGRIYSGPIHVYTPMEHLLPWALEVEHLRIFSVGGALQGCCVSVSALVAGMYRFVWWSSLQSSLGVLMIRVAPTPFAVGVFGNCGLTPTDRVQHTPILCWLLYAFPLLFSPILLGWLAVYVLYVWGGSVGISGLGCRPWSGLFGGGASGGRSLFSVCGRG